MIGPADAEFHAFDGKDSDWAEVFSVSFSVPSEQINARVYLLFRPQFGVVQTSVTVVGQDALLPWKFDYADFQAHAASPASLTGFTLSNGLSLETLAPHSKWRMRFEDKDRATFDVVFDALMQPFSPFDPAINPNARPAAPGTGMIEQSGRVTGTLTTRGQTYAVDCLTMMNHGWGPRRERSNGGPMEGRGLTWLHAHFSERDAVYASWVFELDRPEAMSLVHGYTLRNGQCFGLRSGQARVTHDDDKFPRVIQIDVTDSVGIETKLESTCVHRALWSCWPNMTTFCVYAKWSDADGRTGYGDVLQFSELGALVSRDLAKRRDAAQVHTRHDAADPNSPN